MTLIEAINSGKPFRRQGSIEYYNIKETPGLFFILDEVMATDWEVQEKVVGITFSDFNKAWHTARVKSNNSYDGIYNTLVEELQLR